MVPHEAGVSQNPDFVTNFLMFNDHKDLVVQVRPGMDLSRVVLPTFILEPRFEDSFIFFIWQDLFF